MKVKKPLIVECNCCEMNILLDDSLDLDELRRDDDGNFYCSVECAANWFTGAASSTYDSMEKLEADLI